MSECPSEMQLKHTEQLASMKNEINNIKNIVSDFSTIKDTLIELKILNKQAISFNERQVQSNDKFEETLTNINENLNTLNNRVDHLEISKKKEESTKAEIQIEDKRLRAEQYKSKFTFYGVIVTAVLAMFGIMIPLVMQ